MSSRTKILAGILVATLATLVALCGCASDDKPVFQDEPIYVSKALNYMMSIDLDDDAEEEAPEA